MADDEALPRSIGELIHVRAAISGDTEYLVSGTHRLTYRELERVSGDLAVHMLLAGIGKGTRVGVLFTYSAEWVVTWLAATRVGALVIPLSTIYPAAELAKVIEKSDIDTLVFAPRILGKDMPKVLEAALPGLAAATSADLRLPEAPFLRRAWAAGPTDAPWAEHVDVLDPPTPADDERALLARAEDHVHLADPAVVVYTSGSSAEPKGVVHTHGSVLRGSAHIPQMLTDRSLGAFPRVLCGMPFFWVGGVLTVVGALLSPMTLVVIDKFEAGAALEAIERERVTVIMGWPNLVQAMRAHEDFAKRDLSSAVNLLRGPADPAAVDTPEAGVPRHRGLTESMGTFSAVTTKVVDVGTGEQVGTDVRGELCIRGRGLMHGYLNKERWEVFDDDGWYHTGDQALMYDGDARPYFTGRYTELIKSSGANVSPREVEMALEELPEVTHCIVFGIPSATRGEEVVAVVVPTDPTSFDEDAVRAHARTVLSAYKVPTRWVVVGEGDIPWLGSGKPDKRSLRDSLRLV